MVVSIRMTPSPARMMPGEVLLKEKSATGDLPVTSAGGSCNLPRIKEQPTRARIMPVTKPR